MKRRDFLKKSTVLTTATIAMPWAQGGHHRDEMPVHQRDIDNITVASASKLRIGTLDHAIQFFWNDTLITGYLAAPTQKMPCFSHLSGPKTGIPVTSIPSGKWLDSPAIFLACNHVNGSNFRDGDLATGQIVSQGLRVGTCTPTTGEFFDQCLWLGRGKLPLFEDKRHVQVTVLPDKQYRIDCHFELTPLVDIEIAPTNLALFGVRVADDLSVNGGGHLVNANGETGMRDTFGKPARWCTFRGNRQFNRKTIIEGLTLWINEHPFVNCPWFTRDYGFMSPSPFHFMPHQWRRSQGETMTLDYSVMAYANSLPPNL